MVVNKDELPSAYLTGKGRARIRGEYVVESDKRGDTIVFTSIPYKVSKEVLIVKIDELCNEGKLNGIATIRDESNKDGVRFVIELEKGVSAEPIVSKLFKLTPLENTYSFNQVALIDKKPVLVNMKQLIESYIEHQRDVLLRKTKFDLDNPQVEVKEVDVPELNARIMASKIANMLQRGMHFRRVAYSTIRRIMGAGAQGVEVTISGKIRGSRSAVAKFVEGYIKKCGEPSIRLVEEGFATVQLKPGVLGIYVRIMPPETVLPDSVEILPPKVIIEEDGEVIEEEIDVETEEIIEEEIIEEVEDLDELEEVVEEEATEEVEEDDS